MDDIASYNQSRWDDLARRGVGFSIPYQNLTPEQARASLDPFGMMGDVNGKNVLCLAASGGQQSIAFHLLGARVTVFDLSSVMLERDRETAKQHHASMDIQQGDMRDLSRFPDGCFDLVWHAYSINFVPDPRPVFAEVARVLRPSGLYRIEFHNPLLTGMGETDWDGQGYPLHFLYEDRTEVDDPLWEFENERGDTEKIQGPRAFRHTLTGVINPLVDKGFILLGMWEYVAPEYAGPVEADPAPGTWQHFIRVAPPWLTLWWKLRE